VSPTTPLSPQARRTRQRAEVRGEILAAAESLLVERGFEAFSMRRLARRCGCTAATLYHYFADKDALLDELLEDRFARLRDRMRAVPTRDDPVGYLRDLVAALALYAAEKPTLYRLLTMPVPSRSRRPETAEQTFALIRAPLEALDGEGRLRGGDVETASQSVVALLHGVVSLQQWRPDFGGRPDLLDAAFDALLRGLLAPPGAGEERS